MGIVQTADHRLIDGGMTIDFQKKLKEFIEDPKVMENYVFDEKDVLREKKD